MKKVLVVLSLALGLTSCSVESCGCGKLESIYNNETFTEFSVDIIDKCSNDIDTYELSENEWTEIMYDEESREDDYIWCR
jgi:hypothetical protein